MHKVHIHFMAAEYLSFAAEIIMMRMIFYDVRISHLASPSP